MRRITVAAVQGVPSGRFSGVLYTVTGFDASQDSLEAIDSGSDLSKWEVNLSDEIISKASKPIEKMLSFS